MVTVLNEVANTVLETKSMIKTMSVGINKLHKILGYCGETHLKETDNAYEIKAFGKVEAFKSYAISKAKQNYNNKIWNRSINVPGERLYVDISSIKDENFGGAKF
jgi:hypothetical protein